MCSLCTLEYGLVWCLRMADSFSRKIFGVGKGGRRKKRAAQRNPRQIKESDVRKILQAGNFTAYHLRAGSELNVTTQDLWELADRDLIDGVDLPPLAMYRDQWSRPNKYLWYVAIPERMDEFIEELMTIDIVRRLEE